MDFLEMKRRRLRILLVGAALLGAGAASLSGALAVRAVQPLAAATATFP